MKRFSIVLIFLSILFLSTSCESTPEEEYRKREAKELASGVRNDSLFLGIYLGMTMDDFYAHCWEMNKKGIIMEGANNTTVHYPIQEFKHPASMEFYPSSENGYVTAMPISFYYDGWAPWNKDLQADKLILEVIALMEDWFGTGFTEINNPTPVGSNAFLKVDGNRRITVYYVDDSKVKVDIVDLNALKNSEKKK
ncbi:MAG: hypothetical protein R8P61_18230 [Bacteroidia bacterium]|nr:hypothetical protein [Bacteroidia bacterium]